MILIITTLHEKVDAVRVGKGLLVEKLIVCYNLIPVESAFWWKDKIEEYGEILLILKTKDENFSKIESYIKENSGYEVPEVIALSPQKVNQAYLDWVNTEVK